MRRCAACGNRMKLEGAYHPWCDPEVRADFRNVVCCRVCGEQVKELTDDGECGWCRDRRTR